jgi:hypothetical protein
MTIQSSSVPRIPLLRNVPTTFAFVGGHVFSYALEFTLFHRGSPARLEAWISIKHIPDRIRVHRLAVLFGDMIDDIPHHPCAGISVSYVTDEVVVFLMAENW